MAASVKESDTLNPKTVEALAILWSLQQYIHLGLTHLIIESDYQFVVNKLLVGDFDLNLGIQFVDIREWMGKFLDCHIQFAFRECN